MKKRLISLIVAVVMLFSMLCPAAYADDETVSFDTCTHEWETPLRSGYSITIPGSDVSFSVKTEQCKKCKWYKHVATIFIAEFTYYSPLNVDANGLVPTELATYWANVWYNNFGKNATATKFTPGGGSTSGGGVGRPKGYADDNGTPNYNNNGAFQVVIWPDIAIKSSSNPFNSYPYSFNFTENNYYVTGNNNSILYNYTASSNGYYLSTYLRYSLKCKVNGLYYVENGQEAMSHIYNYNTKEFFSSDIWPNAFSKKLSAGSETVLLIREVSTSVMSSYKKYTAIVHPLVVTCIPDTITINNYNTITINNNTWNGNIYTDNSTNLTYIYPQYTTVNEKNETVTNISNTPIIYNNETKKYYTYDNVTKDWTLQGSDDGETWDDLDTQKDQNLSDKEEHKYSLTLRKAYKYYRLNMSNYASSMCSLSHFNLLGYDAKDVVTPTPAPTDPPLPSPAPDPGKPDSGDKTNNFWTIIFPNGGGTEDGKKGIFWALVSLILALIAFFANLAVGVGYLFPFLPDGVVMTINTCLIVIFLFTIIKFIMRSK